MPAGDLCPAERNCCKLLFLNAQVLQFELRLSILALGGKFPAGRFKGESGGVLL